MDDRSIGALLEDMGSILGELQATQDADIESAFGYIRSLYSVPARIGACIVYGGGDGFMDGVVVSAQGHYIKAILDDGHEYLLHPTWRIEYLEGNDGDLRG